MLSLTRITLVAPPFLLSEAVPVPVDLPGTTGEVWFTFTNGRLHYTPEGLWVVVPRVGLPCYTANVSLANYVPTTGRIDYTIKRRDDQ